MIATVRDTSTDSPLDPGIVPYNDEKTKKKELLSLSGAPEAALPTSCRWHCPREGDEVEKLIPVQHPPTLAKELRRYMLATYLLGKMAEYCDCSL